MLITIYVLCVIDKIKLYTCAEQKVHASARKPSVEMRSEERRHVYVLPSVTSIAYSTNTIERSFLIELPITLCPKCMHPYNALNSFCEGIG